MNADAISEGVRSRAPQEFIEFLAGKQVLVVDDRLVNTKPLLRYLKKKGMLADYCPSALEALETLKSGTYSAVITDILMPGLDGISFTRRVREGLAGEAARSIPILGMTGLMASDHERRCKEAGMQACFSKPVFNALVYRKLADLLCGGSVRYVIRHAGEYPAVKPQGNGS